MTVNGSFAKDLTIYANRLHVCFIVVFFNRSKTQYMACYWCASILQSQKYSQNFYAAAPFSPTPFSRLSYLFLFILFKVNYLLVLPFGDGRVFGGTSLKAKRYRALHYFMHQV